MKIKEESDTAVINLALDTIRKGKQALIFVNTKRSAEKTAEEIARKLKPADTDLANKVLKVLARPTVQCRRLADSVEKGIAFHHAGLVQKQRELIEDNFREGKIKIICCTPTLAYGMSLPAFRAIIRDLKRFGHRGMEYIPVLEYHQMAGRCVSGDTIILTERGNSVKISKLATDYFRTKETGKKEVKNLRILSVNLKTFKPVLASVRAIWKRKVKKLVEIETRSGKIIKVSEDHPFLVFTKIECGKARISKVFDDRAELYNKVMRLRKDYGWGENKISRHLEMFEKRNMIRHWLTGKIRARKNTFCWKPAHELRKSVGYKKTDHLASLINFNKFDEIIPVRTFLPQENIIKIDKDTFMTKQGHIKCGFPEKWSEDLCRFIAKIMSDGSIYCDKKDNSFNISYYNKNASVQEEYSRMCLRLFNKKVSIKWRREGYSAIFKSYIVGKFLENIGISSGKKSFILRIPHPLFVLPKNMIKSFFREYSRCDGRETPEGYFIITSNKELAYDFALLLSKIGYIARVYKKKLNNWGKNEIWETSVTKSQFDHDKKTSHVGNICPDLIKNIKEINEEDYVYDLTLAEEHNFVANGLIIHNSGRPEYDKFGEAICIATTKAMKEEIKEKFINGKPEDIYSKLAVEPVLRTYLLSLIAANFVRNRKQIVDFFSKTFWAYQFTDMERLKEIIDKMLALLEEWEFIKRKQEEFTSADEIDDDITKPTLLGKRVAELYIDPLTAYYLIERLRKATNKELKPFSFLQAISNTLEMRPLLRVKNKEYEMVEETLVNYSTNLLEDEPSMYDLEYNDFINSIKTALFMEDWINEKSEEELLEKYDIRPGEIRVKLDNGDWLLYSMHELCRISKFQKLLKEITKVRLRLKNGVKEELLGLLRLKNTGRVRARRLFNNRIKTIEDVKKVDLGKLKAILGENVALNIKEQVGEKIIPIKKHKRKGQISLSGY